MYNHPSEFQRIAITGFAQCNALGHDNDSIWHATLDMRTGITRLIPGPDDPLDFFTPPYELGLKSYCDAMGSCRPAITRQDVGLPPQDFQALSASSKLTLYTGAKAVEASGLAGAGYDPDRVAVIVSQNAGEAASTLWDLNLSLRADMLARMAAAHGGWDQKTTQAFAAALRKDRLQPSEGTMLCRLNCTAAGMLSLRYGFTGPSYSTGAACSSSMAALATAVHMLRSGSIDAAVIGGGEEMYAPLYLAEFSALGALARAGAGLTDPGELSRPFDRRRCGFVLGEGSAMLVLERESTAKKRNAPLHGLITGMGNVTNSKGLIEPDAAAQAKAIRHAFAETDYGPSEVELVECHATSTVQGDLEEGRALAQLYSNSGRTVLSAYKGQIGHTTGASGAMALIHGLLSMRDKIFPGTANYCDEDPAIPLREAGLHVLPAPEEWKSPASGIRRLQVNSFAFGGACFALHVEEPNDRVPGAGLHPAGGIGNMGNAGNGGKANGENTSTQLADFTGSEDVENGVRFVTLTHAGQPWRLGATTPQWRPELAVLPAAPTPDELAALSRRGLWLSPDTKAPRVAVTCCGQGSMWPGMGRALYDTFPAARAAMDRVAAAASWDVLSLLDEKDIDKIILTRWQQPYLFLLEYAQASYLESLGFKADVMSGHSLGELIALCLAGVYTPEQGWLILDTRAEFMGELEAKSTQEMGMMAVHGPLPVVDEVLRTYPELRISNYNTPTQFILSGPRDMLTEARRTLRKSRVAAVPLNVSMAFHHPSMRVLRDKSLERLRELEVQPARMPMISNVTTQLYPTDQASISECIGDLDENAVRWVECVQNMWHTHGVRHFVEFGPGDTVSGLTSDIMPDAVCIPTGRKDREVEGMRTAVARLYVLGHLPRRTLHPVPNQMPVHVAPATSAPTATTSAPSPAAAQDVPPHVEDIMPLIMEATGYQRHELEPDMDLRHDLAIRSSRFPMIMHAAEEHFNVTMRFEDMVQVATIRDLADALVGLRSTTESSGTSKAPEQATAPLDQVPVRRYIPASVPLALPAALPDKDMASHLSPLLLVGAKAAAKWHKLLTSMPGMVVHTAATPEEALALLQKHDSQARTLLVAVEEESTDPTSQLMPHTLLLQAFLKRREAAFCLYASTENGSGVMGSPLAAGLSGLLLSAALEWPQVLFRTVLAEHNISPAAAEGWMRQALAQTREMDGTPLPLVWRLHATTAATPLVQAQPWGAVPNGLPLRAHDVILVSGGHGGIAPHALQGLAPLGCTLVLLGRSGHVDMAPLKKLEDMGSQVRYVSCDITDATAVAQCLEDIRQEYGHVDGVLHFAGLNRDATLQALSAEDAEAVIAVKCRGLVHLLEKTENLGLRYAAAFSSLAGWLGNYGQSTYSAANRAMSVLLEQWCEARRIPWRAIWLPPVTGAGMASGDDVREQLRQRGLENAWLEAEELGGLLARELLCGNSAQCLWARALPSLPTVAEPAPLSLRASKGLAEKTAIYPTVFPRELLAGAQPLLKAGRQFSSFAIPELAASAAPLPTGPVRLLSSLWEAAHMAAPWLRCTGLDNVSLAQPHCPPGVTREASVLAQWQEWALPPEGKSPQLLCSVSMELRGLSTNGRRTDQWEGVASASVRLTAPGTGNMHGSLAPLWTEGQISANLGQCQIVPVEEIARKDESRYEWPWRCIEAIARAVDSGAAIEAIAHVNCGEAPAPQASVHAAWRPHPQDPALFDAQVLSGDNSVLLTVEGLRIRRSGQPDGEMRL